MLALGVHPLVAFLVGHSLMALESLAVLPVINSLVFIFRAMGLSYQEVGIALIGKKGESYTVVRDFAFILGTSVVLILGLIAFTPLAYFWFETFSGLSVDLAKFSIFPTQIMVLMPGLSVMLSFQRAIQVAARDTGHLTWATVLEVLGIVAVLFILTFYVNMIGAIAATTALLLGRIVANLYLINPNKYRYNIWICWCFFWNCNLYCPGIQQNSGIHFTLTEPDMNSISLKFCSVNYCGTASLTLGRCD